MNLLLCGSSVLLLLYLNHFEIGRAQSGGSGGSGEENVCDPEMCKSCTGEQNQENEDCVCKEGFVWDGNDCVRRTSSPELSSGEIAGIVIGSIAGGVLLVGGAYYFIRKPSMKSITMADDLEVSFRHKPFENRSSITENDDDSSVVNHDSNEEDKTTGF